MGEWSSAPLKEHASIVSGQHVEAGLCNTAGMGRPYLTGPADFPDGTVVITKYTRFPKVMCEPRDILVTVKGSGTGKVAVAEDDYCISRQLMAVRATSCDKDYLRHVLYSFTDRLRAEALGFIPGIGRSDLLELKPGFPSLPEQRQIAAILDTIDDAIRKTEQIIAKLKQVKQGLLHDLLTRGIDDNGELRDLERHPEQFEGSLLGQIPRGWDVRKLGDALSSIDAGWSPACVEVPPSTGIWGVLKVSAVTSGEFLSHESKTLPGHMAPILELEVHEGDIILARANGVADLVGITVEATRVQPHLMLSDKLLRLVPQPMLLIPSFLAHAMRGAAIRQQVARIISGSSGQKNLSQSHIRRLLVALPPTAEQTQSARLLCAHGIRQEREGIALEKLRLLKAGLIEDLLTGRVRVTKLLETAAE